MALPKPKMVRVQGDGVTIQLAIWEGEGKVVFCVPGKLANSRSWDLIASALSPKYRVIAMDKRGRGLSDKPGTGYSIEHHIRDIRCVLDELGIERIVLMGQSLGAYIGMIFASKHPDQLEKLILIDSGGQLSIEQWQNIGLAVQASYGRLGKVFSSPDAYLNTVKQYPLNKPWSPAMESNFRHEIEEVEGGVRCRTQLTHMQEESQNDLPILLRTAEYYPKIACKTLILRATEPIGTDVILLPKDATEKMLQKISNVKLVDVKGTTHVDIVFQPHKARDHAILDFLEA